MYDKGELFDPSEHLAALRRGKWKLIDGIVRDPHWYTESGRDGLNSTDDTWVVPVGEAVVRAMEYVFGRGPTDSFRSMIVHTVFHGM